jgi:hypothetical protein
MAKIRHISYRAEDVDAMGMTMIQKRKDNAIDLSNSSVNISVLPLAANKSRRVGLDHIGFPAEDDREQIRRMEAAGAERAHGLPMKKNLKVPRA